MGGAALSSVYLVKRGTLEEIPMRLRFSVLSLVSLLCAALASPLAAGVNRWTPIGPGGGYVNVVTAAPSRPATLYAGLKTGGVFRSLNHGQTWQATGLSAGLTVRDLAVDPQTPQKVYAATLTGLYRSMDGGATWLGPFLGARSITQIEVHPRDARVLFAGTAGETLFKSTDQGRTWKTAAGWPTGVTTIAFDPIRPATLYAGTNEHGTWRSDDGGATWKPIDNGLPENLLIRRIAIDPRSTLYLVATATGRAMIFWSRDRGESWKPRDRGLDDQYFGDIAVDPSSPAIVHVTTEHGLLRSTDRGATWSPVVLPGLGTAFPQELEATRERLLVATTGGIFASADRGLSLQPSNQGLWATSILSLAVDAQEPPRLYASDLTAGIFKTRRQGPPWVRLLVDAEPGINWAGTPLLPLAVDPQNPSVVYAGKIGQVGKSTDGGGSWTSKGAFFCLAVSSIRIDPAEPSTLYASGSLTSLWCATQPGACDRYRSLDGGETWTCMQDRPRVLAVDRFTSAAYALSSNALAPSDLYRSTDRGDTWTLIHAGLGATLLAASPVTPETLWALRPGETGRSTDGGETWELHPLQGLDVKGVSKLVPDPADPLRLYAVSHDVFRSDDGGHTWEPVGPGLEDITVTDLVVDPIDPRILYAGTASRGVMRIEQEE